MRAANEAPVGICNRHDPSAARANRHNTIVVSEALNLGIAIKAPEAIEVIALNVSGITDAVVAAVASLLVLRLEGLELISAPIVELRIVAVLALVIELILVLELVLTAIVELILVRTSVVVELILVLLILIWPRLLNWLF